eukprot:1814780-Rhodomonas_salina.1
MMWASTTVSMAKLSLTSAAATSQGCLQVGHSNGRACWPHLARHSRQKVWKHLGRRQGVQGSSVLYFSMQSGQLRASSLSSMLAAAAHDQKLVQASAAVALHPFATLSLASVISVYHQYSFDHSHELRFAEGHCPGPGHTGVA